MLRGVLRETFKTMPKVRNTNVMKYRAPGYASLSPDEEAKMGLVQKLKMAKLEFTRLTRPEPAKLVITLPNALRKYVDAI